jgi:hypothetical protein
MKPETRRDAVLLVPPDPPARRRSIARAARAAGAVAGLLGALLMELAAVVIFGATGQGGWWLSRLVAAAVLGRSELPGGRMAGLVGLVLHLCVGTVLGTIYGAMVPRRPARPDVVALPLLYSVSVFVFMTYAVLTWADPVMFRRVGKGWFFVLHLVYGLALYVTVPLRDALLRGRPRRPRRAAPGATAAGGRHSPGAAPA